MKRVPSPRPDGEHAVSRRIDRESSLFVCPHTRLHPCSALTWPGVQEERTRPPLRKSKCALCVQLLVGSSCWGGSERFNQQAAPEEPESDEDGERARA